MPDPVSRSTTFDLLPPAGQRQQITDSIRRYRAACAHCYGILLLAQHAGATIQEHAEGIRIAPNNDRTKVLLSAALDSARIERGERVRGQGQPYTVSVGSAMAYEMRSLFLAELFPAALSFVWDSARRDVTAVWTAKDPEFTRASRGWLTLQGARGVARFQRRGIGLPVATARPKLDGRELVLKWDRDLGEVRFGLPRLDGGRFHVWRALRDQDEGWSLGTVYLTEREGRVFAVITHQRPAQAADVDPERVCRVTVDGTNLEQFIVIGGPDGAATMDTISGADVSAWQRQMHARKVALEARRAACGNPRRPWGHRRGWRAAQDVLSRLTLQRQRGEADRNHAWTRRIVTRAASWRCGRVEITRPADGLFGLPWAWSTGFDAFARYKAEACGMAVSIEASSTPEAAPDGRATS